MVSEDSSSNSNILREFVASNHFGSHSFDASYSNSLPLSIHSLSERMSRSIDIVVGPDRHLIDLVGKSNEASHHQHQSQSQSQSQRLSLSLGGSSMMNSSNPNFSFMGFDYDGNGYAPPWSGNQSFVALLMNSKYLHPAQSLLEEMLSVGGEAIDRSNSKYTEKLGRKGPFRLSSKLKAELSTCELACDKHGDYVDLLKLIALLEEV